MQKGATNSADEVANETAISIAEVAQEAEEITDLLDALREEFERKEALLAKVEETLEETENILQSKIEMIVEKDQKLKKIENRTTFKKSLSCSADGKNLLIRGLDNSVSIWGMNRNNNLPPTCSRILLKQLNCKGMKIDGTKGLETKTVTFLRERGALGEPFNEKKRRAEFQDKLEMWKKEGLRVSPLEEIMDKDLDTIEVEFTTFEKDLEKLRELQQKTKENKSIGELSELELRPEFTFDTFVVGTSNRFTHAAALAVAEAPADVYNPLFVYGGVGLGKTHICNAIGNHVKELKPEMNIVFVTSEKFTNELIESTRLGQIDDFRNLYRTADLLIIDDIQFLAGKEATQEEFFHTFDALYNAHKQIMVSSDRPPKDIKNLDEKLRSRFEAGLITDIQPPSLETKIKILRREAKKQNIEVPDEVMHLIASKVKSNIRELRGSLTKIIAHSKLRDQNDLTEDFAKEVLKEFIDEKPKKAAAEAEDERPTKAVHISDGLSSLGERLSSLKDRLDTLKKEKIEGEDELEGAEGEVQAPSTSEVTEEAPDVEEGSEFAKCGNCRELIPANVPSCPNCGVSFTGETYECPKCHAMIGGDANKCDKCGTEFGAGFEEEEPKSKPFPKKEKKKK